MQHWLLKPLKPPLNRKIKGGGRGHSRFPALKRQPPPPIIMDKNLTQKQALFVKEYLVDLNATQAAIRAGYSAKTAGQMGDENLKKPQISAAVQKGIEKRNKRIEITQDKVLEDIESIKRHAMREIYDAQGNVIMSNYPTALRAAELHGKHLGIFKDKFELTGANGGPVRIQTLAEFYGEEADSQPES